MSRGSVLNVRIDEELKVDAADVLATYGLTVSDAVRVFLTSVVRTKSLPAELVMNDEAYQAWLDERMERMFKNRSESRPARDFLADL